MSSPADLGPAARSALREVLEPTRAGIHPESGDDLVDALTLAAEASGTAVMRERVSQVARTPSADPEECARRLGVPIRRVEVGGDWWRAECGPYVVVDDDGRMAAALPDGNRYVLVRGNLVQRIDQDLAGRIGRRAWTVTPRLPPDGTGLRDLIDATTDGGIRGDVVRLVLFAVTVALLGAAVPLWAGWVIGELVPLGAVSRTVAGGVILVLVALAIAGITYLQAVVIQRIAARLDTRSVAAVIDRLVRLPLPFFREHQTGALVQRVQGLDQSAPLLSIAFLRVLTGVVLALSGFVVMVVLYPGLALVVLGVLLLVGVFVAVVLRRQLHARATFYDRNLALSGLTLAVFTGIAKIRVAAAEGRIRSLWVGSYAMQQQAAAEVARGTQRLGFVAVLAPVLVTLTVVAGSIAGGSTSDLGRFTSFLTASGQLATALAGLLVPLSVVVGSLPVIRAVRTVLHTEPEPMGSTAEPAFLEGGVEVTDLSFSYGEVPILRGVRLHAEPGEFVALVGPSGSGKTTLTRLLLGLETPQTGEILYDGRVLDQLGAESVRREVGVVTQSAALSTGSLLENIIGASTLTEEDAWRAAALAGIADDIRAMPMGMQTPVSDGAATFSGGQKQRILLARALARGPRILILDEATSALDDRTQAAVSDALTGLGVTRIVVAHRLSTIRAADRIYVLDHGHVVQAGAFAELMTQPGLFAELVARQTTVAPGPTAGLP